VAELDTKAKRFALLKTVDNLLSQSAVTPKHDRKPPARMQTQARMQTPQSKSALNVVASDQVKASEKNQDQPSSTKKRKKQKSDVSKQQSYVEQRVARYFEGVLYRGRVNAYFPSEEMESKVEAWEIIYDDGDTEDVDEAQLRKIINQYKRKRHEFSDE
jgi:hypothetical protein